MNKEPQEVDWSKQKPMTIGVTRGGKQAEEFIESRGEEALFWSSSDGYKIRYNNGRVFTAPTSDGLDILLPWESCLAEGHNPDGLTNGQVGEGWRLIASLSERPKIGTQLWCNSSPQEKANPHWKERIDCENPYCDTITYRVPITPPVAKVPVAKATKRVPCGPEHFPPGTILRHNDFPNAWPMVIWVESHGIGSMDSNGNFVKETYSQIVGFNGQRSIDGGKTWLPCYVEVEA